MSNLVKDKEVNEVQINHNLEKIDKLKSIKTTSIITLIGWFLLVIPGIIASIVLIIKLCIYNDPKESNKTLRIMSIILTFFTIIVGPIVSLIWAKQEIEYLTQNY